MTFPSRTLAALLVTASVPLFAGSVAAAPIGQSLALSNVETSQVEQVQWRRHRSGRWIGPAAGIAAGIAIGSALAPRYYYDEPYAAYGYAPGPVYQTAPAYRYAPGYSYGYSRGACTGDGSHDSAYPSWQC